MARKKLQKDARHTDRARAPVDGWSNVLTGLGTTTRDKRLGATYCVNEIDQNTAEGIWRGDDIAGRIVETVPNEMLRQGFEVQVAGDKELSEEMDNLVRSLNLVELVRQCLYYSRAYGGAGLVLGVVDGAPWDRPLNEQAIRSLTWANVFSPSELTADTWYSQPLGERYGEVRSYRLNPLFITQDTPAAPERFIHESRLIRFSGQQTSRSQALRGVQPGWDDSIFVRIMQVVSDFQSVWQAAGILMQDFAPPVLRMKGLVELLQASKHNQQVSVADRLQAVELSRSIARLVLIDKDEEYKRETTNITGLPEMLDKFMSRLAAAADMPVSLMVGQAPAGLNATGDSEIRWFYDRVAAMQRRQLEPSLRRLVRLLFLSKTGPTNGKEPENWSVKFPSLWQMTDAERADTYLKMAQADALYVTNNVLLPEEVARSRFGGDGWSAETQVDMAERQTLQESMATKLLAEKSEAEGTQNAREPGDKSIPGTKGTETR
jgi:uncharacterized protein